MAINILVVEDESRMREFIGVYFRAEGFNVYEAENGIKALKILAENNINLIVLDIMMPELDGFEVCKRVRETSNVPIIILTAVEGEEQQLLGYELGADDYITKPFKGKILVAKAKRILERSSEVNEKAVLKYEGVKIELDAREIFVSGEKVDFAPKEFDLLVYLAENYGVAKSRDQILNNVWGYDYFGEARVVDNHIKKIRKKLKNYSSYIKTVISIGYKFEVK